ncbi:MAG TPA: PEP-CTERM sorting domain-containing protein [Rhodanobacter sp.]|nr:PEP-CTERM sorting domain-containing protein [Rhodanobacter sp.]
MKKHTFGWMSAAAIALFAMSAPAFATPISVYNNATTTPPDTLRFTLGCGSADGDCAGMLEVLISASPASAFDSTNGSLFNLANSSPSTAAAFVDANTGATFTTGTQTQAGGADTYEFFTSAEYFTIKIGTSPNYALFHNLDGTLDLFFQDTAGTGSGFSHYTEFGSATSVPEPAELGVFGVGLLLIGGFLGLRRRYS